MDTKNVNTTETFPHGRYLAFHKPKARKQTGLTSVRNAHILKCEIACQTSGTSGYLLYVYKIMMLNNIQSFRHQDHF